MFRCEGCGYEAEISGGLDFGMASATLEAGFDFEGEKVRLVGPQGIFKPKQISTVPLFITTAPKGPYSDHF
jgi:hypothetical protein